MGKLITLWVRRAQRQFEPATEEQATSLRSYCAWKQACYFPDRAAKPRMPSRTPVLRLVRSSG